jgi:aryl-alcohol dehydrogenase-like predicted oxidoreductase
MSNTALLTKAATREGTLAHKEKYSDFQFNELGSTGLLVSQAGFGCFRVRKSDEFSGLALKNALQSGVNVVEIASNYADGDAEEIVGDVLEGLINDGKIDRNEVVLIAKGGYLQGKKYSDNQQRKINGNGYKEVIDFCEGFEYCIHPKFLADQITETLNNLKVDAVDGYLVHNPEHYLSWASKQPNFNLQAARRECYLRIKESFLYLEQEVVRGRIAFYGVSSRALPLPENEVEFISLEELMAIAESISANNNFKLVQFPMNLLETGGITNKNQSNGQSTLELAREKGLAVVINRPLNAFLGNKMTRLVDYEDFKEVTKSGVLSLVQAVAAREKVFEAAMFEQLGLVPEKQSDLLNLMSTGKKLNTHWQNFRNFEHWRDTCNQFFTLRIKRAVEIILASPGITDQIESWLKDYLADVNKAMESLANYYKGKSSWKSKAIREMVQSADSDWANAGMMSQIAVRALRSTKGVNSVLVGMRQANYVEDVLNEIKKPVMVEDKNSSWEKMTI